MIKTKSIKKILFDNIFTLFNLVNLLLALSVAYVHSYRNMLFMSVVFWNIFIGVVQEIRSKKIIDRLSLLSAPSAIVLKEGEKKTISPPELALNDIMLLESGNQICADSIVTEGSCEVNESLLTGENDPITKNPGDTLYSGSFIVSGCCCARVIHVGMDNYVNTITQKAKYVKKINSEMFLSIKKIIKLISICLIPIAILLFLRQLNMQEGTFQQAVVNTAAAIIGMIPSGLVLLISMVLAVSSIKLAKKNVLVQDLYCIENLSRVDVLCLDKTGTITEGSMHVEDIIPLSEEEFPVFKLKTILYHFSHSLKDNNATFLAIKERSEEFFSGEKPLSSWEIHGMSPFSSARKWSMADFENEGCFVTGACEFIFPEMENKLREKSEDLGKRGLRVLCLGYSPNHSDNNELPQGLTPIAFILLTDKIRSDAKKTLSYFKKQGVEIKVISGDGPATVSYIADRAGLDKAADFIDASTIKSEEELENACEKYSIFGRVTPDQKLSIVKYLKSHGHTVAMTGDGVNDVLALKEADCSIAMQCGSDAARTVSQIVLMDSKFSSMPAIVEEGRRTINNLQRSASLYLTKTIYSSFLALIFIFLNRQFPFMPIQTTLIGALTIGIPSFILALEPNLNRVRGKFLANILRLAVPGGLLAVICIIASEICGNVFSLSYESISTIAAYSLFIASATELYKVCQPFNNLRKFLFCALMAVFMASAVFFRNFFGFTLIQGSLLLYVLALIPICGILFYSLDLLTERFLGTAPNVYKTYPCRTEGLNCVMVVDQVDKKDYYNIGTLMKKNRILRPKRVFFLYSPSRGADIAVDSWDEAFDPCFIGLAASYCHRKNPGKKKKILVECPYYEKPVAVTLKKNYTIASFDLPENEFYPDLPKAGHYEKRVHLFGKRKVAL